MSGSVMIRGRNIAVNIERELDAFEWNKKSIRGGKLLACSPFRKGGNERHPSFAVRLDNGVWIDSGAKDDSWRKGSFVRMLAALRGEDEAETEEYLLNVYDANYADVENLSLDLNLQLDKSYKEIHLPHIMLDQYKFRHPYLERRGIDEKTQRLFYIGYDRDSKAITIPWYNRFGAFTNIKFRSVVEKKFWYLKGGGKISDHVYGLDLIVSQKIKRAFITESEIDCMYLWANGFHAVALGGSSISVPQRENLMKSGIRELVIATDNDPAGEKAGQRIANAMAGWVDIEKLVIPHGKKDVNELSPSELFTVAKNVTTFPYTFVA